MSTLQFLQWLLLFVILFYIYNLIVLFRKEELPSVDYSNLEAEITRLEKLLASSNDEIIKLRKELSKEDTLYQDAIHRLRVKERRISTAGSPKGRDWSQAIPVIVFACNRPNALKQHVDKLLRYRPNAEEFPIIISQDCDNKEVAAVANDFGSSVHYIKHLSGDKANISVAPDHHRYLTYYMIARHYKLGLTHVFDELNYTSVIITEDDLDVAPDFFNYFNATRRLLDADSTIYCISAWNDNGKENLIDMKGIDLLYRSDFFSGLGWMMSKKLWVELGPIWPSGFWDDWIRDPLRRKNRTCIRPEISRTAMTKEGQKGASKGLFFAKHLAKIKLNTQPMDFTSMNLDFLLKENYDVPFLSRVYSAPLTNLSSLTQQILRSDNAKPEYRLEYETLSQYLSIADGLQIMRDFKAGVPRTAYFGVVTCFINNVRIFVAPERSTWKTYNPGWEAPENPADMSQAG